jgi:hypothetical protein
MKMAILAIIINQFITGKRLAGIVSLIGNIAIVLSNVYIFSYIHSTEPVVLIIFIFVPIIGY